MQSSSFSTFSDPQAELTKLAARLLETAKPTLAYEGYFYPFGGKMTQDGWIDLVELESEDEEPEPEEMIEELTSLLEDATAEEALQVVGKCIQVRVIPQGEQEKCEAVLARVEHASGVAMDFFTPYQIDESGQVSYGASFTKRGQAEIFSAEQETYAQVQRKPLPQSKTGPGISTLVKIILGLSAIFLLFPICCCGGIIGFALMVTGSTNEPTEINNWTQEIAEIDLPPKLFPVRGKKTLGDTSILYHHLPSQSYLLLFSADELGEFQASEEKTELINMLDWDESLEEVRILDSIQFPVSVGNPWTMFDLSQCQGNETGKRYEKVTGCFLSREGPMNFSLRLQNDTFPEGTAQKITQTLKVDD